MGETFAEGDLVEMDGNGYGPELDGFRGNLVETPEGGTPWKVVLTVEEQDRLRSQEPTVRDWAAGTLEEDRLYGWPVNEDEIRKVEEEN